MEDTADKGERRIQISPGEGEGCCKAERDEGSDDAVSCGGFDVSTRLSELRSKIEKLDCEDTLALKQMYFEIGTIQKSIEEWRLFKDGQELYSKWLEVALKNLPKQDLPERIAMVGDKDNPKDLIALGFNNRGYLKYLDVDFEGAMQDYTKALSFNDVLPYAYYNRGLVTYRLAFFDQAVEDMTRAVKLSPQVKEFKEGLERVKEMQGSVKGHSFRLECDS